MRTDVFDGQTVHTLLSDYQGRPSGGNGWLRIMHFVPADNTIQVMTYSPTLDQFESDGDSEFTLTYDMAGVPFVELGTVSDVPSDTDATLVWTDREVGATYEWFATAWDGEFDSASAVWSFETTWAVGDLNCDGVVDFRDINPFVLALVDPTAWQSAYPDCDLLNADINGDGEINFGDINPFVVLLSTGG
jgi:hypothetical protein